jgi:hypothetical protein
VRTANLKILAIAGLLLAATDHAQETKPVPATPMDVKKADLGEKVWSPAWDLIVEKAIPPAMLSQRSPTMSGASAHAFLP